MQDARLGAENEDDRILQGLIWGQRQLRKSGGISGMRADFAQLMTTGCPGWTTAPAKVQEPEKEQDLGMQWLSCGTSHSSTRDVGLSSRMRMKSLENQLERCGNIPREEPAQFPVLLSCCSALVAQAVTEASLGLCRALS